MNNGNLQTDVYMTTEHIKNTKPKVSFSMVMNKVLVGALILTTATGIVAPTTAYAASVDSTKAPTTVTQNYEMSFENVIFNTNQTLKAIDDMRSDGIVTNKVLTVLATQLNDLAEIANSSNKESISDIMNEVANIVVETRNMLGQIKVNSENKEGVTRVESALVNLSNSIGFDENKVAEALPNVKIESIGGSMTMTNSVLEATKTTTTKKVTSPTSFTDVKKGDTYYTAVNYLAKKGAIGGYKDGKFKPSTKITNAKFIGILMRTIDSKLPRATKGKDYDTKAIEAAYKAGIIKSSEVNSKNYDKVLTRQDMVLYLSRTLEYLNKDVSTIQDISNLIPDFDKVEDTKYEDAVKELYSAGIFTGTSKTYEFKPTATVGRGTAVNSILKVVESKYRTNMSKVKIPQTTTEARETRELKWNDANRGLAKIGDTWVAKDGKKTKLKGIEWNGTTVPGYGQGIDLYSGLKSDGGVTLKVGGSGGFYHRDTTYSGQELQQAKSHKGVKFTYFRDQWLAINSVEQAIAAKIKNPKHKQYAEGTHFMQWYDGVGWVWLGPVY